MVHAGIMLQELLIFLVVLAAIPNIIFCVGFWWFNLRTGHREVIRQDYGFVALPVALAHFTNGLSMIAAFAMLPFGLLSRVRGPVVDPECGKPPMIFVHGLVHNASAWAAHRRWFARAGYRIQYFYTYNSLTVTVPEIVSGLQKFIRETAAAHPGEKLVFVGHSLGGLSLRAALADREISALGAALVTLGAPHQGSVLANLGLNPLSRSLRYRGPLIREIESQPDPDLPRLSIYTLFDSIVVPNEGTRIRRPGWTERRTGIKGHVDLLFSREDFKAALDFIEENV